MKPRTRSLLKILESAAELQCKQTLWLHRVELSVKINLLRLLFFSRPFDRQPRIKVFPVNKQSGALTAATSRHDGFS